MPGSDIGSVSGSSVATDEEEVVLFACKKCGKHLKASEKDEHRAEHRQPKRKRASSPNQSEAVTLFEQVVVGTSKNVRVSSRGRNLPATTADLAKKKAEMREESGKRRSIKNFDKNVKPKKFNTG